ncbi:MAG: M14 family metallopeptidase [Candidatus Promineifilaceae bacterium]|nr:M14 family metallopeptidase [Candidatus Promineifilaceae bacterium]
MTASERHRSRPLFLLALIAVLISALLLSARPALVADGETVGGEAPPAEAREVVRAYFDSREQVTWLARWRAPWEVDHEAGYLVLDVAPEEAERLEAAGFQLETDAVQTATLHRPQNPLAEQTTGIPGFPCYRTVEETLVTAAAIAADYPTLAEWVDIGDSWVKRIDPNAGYDIMVLRLTNRARDGVKPRIFIMSALHAREYATAELNMRFAEYLAENYGENADVTWLLDYHEIHLLLQANPDGRKQAENDDPWWRKNTNENYCGATSDGRGADLNRNFSFNWGCCGGSSSHACYDTYRGPSAASEPETQAIEAYLRAHFPDQRGPNYSDAVPSDASGLFIDLHSYSELILWPWGHTYDPAPNWERLRTLGRKFAYFNGYNPIQSSNLYKTDGTTESFAYGELGLAAYTFELGTAFHQSCSDFEGKILPDNLRALLYAARVARAPYRIPSGPDTVDLSVSSAEHGLRLTARIDDTRYSNRQGYEYMQPIQTAIYTVDRPPWEEGVERHPLFPQDGAFDSTVEMVEAMISPTRLLLGRHTIFVQGQDIHGNWGAVSAIFVGEEAQRFYLPVLRR